MESEEKGKEKGREGSGKVSLHCREKRASLFPPLGTCFQTGRDISEFNLSIAGNLFRDTGATKREKKSVRVCG